MKIMALFSLINILFLAGLYAGLLKPMLEEQSEISSSKIKLESRFQEHQKSLLNLRQSLANTSPAKKPTLNQLTKTIIKLAKKQHLTIKQVEPISADTTNKQNPGLSIQTSGSYQNSLKFIFTINQLPFLLHWSNITLLRDKEIELTGDIRVNT